MIAEHCIEIGETSRKARALVNSYLAGGNHYNTFHGRKKEWEEADGDYVREVLHSDAKFFKCADHKTASSYGEIIKLLTPGVKGSMRASDAMPRPPSCKTFFVPCSSSSKCVSMPTSLMRFNHDLLKDEKVKPTSNQCRKFFHETLMELTADREKCKEFMVVLDAHSRKTMNKHYLFRNPKHDLVLAETLVENVLGDTVPWPTDEDVEIFLRDVVQMSRSEYVNHLLETCACETDEDDDVDDDEPPLLDWDQSKWFGGDFGRPIVPQLDLLPLAGLDAKEHAAVATMQPIADISGALTELNDISAALAESRKDISHALDRSHKRHRHEFCEAATHGRT